MVANRDSIIKAATELCDLIDEGGEITSAHKRLADKLRLQARTGGSYKKKYDNEAERVMYRHLNLYKNKLAKSGTEAERTRWRTKIGQQKAKIAAYEADPVGGLQAFYAEQQAESIAAKAATRSRPTEALDLDGL